MQLASRHHAGTDLDGAPKEDAVKGIQATSKYMATAWGGWDSHRVGISTPCVASF